MTLDDLLYRLALAACMVSGTTICLICGIDKQGAISLSQMTQDPLAIGAFLIPLTILATVAWWRQGRLGSLVACLLTAIVVGPWSSVVLWDDHLAWRRELPGRGTQHMGMLKALVILWAGCGIVVLIAVGERLYLGNRPVEKQSTASTTI